MTTPAPTLSLHQYQHDAVQYLRAHDRGAGLLLEMGMGKSAITLSALQPHHLPALVVAPKRVAENVWSKEASLWRPDLTVRVAAGAPQARRDALTADADITVLGRDNLKDATPLAEKGRWRTLIIDELSGFKSQKSLRWRQARKIRKHVDRVWGLTGTPTPNGLMDLWAQIYLLDGGSRLGRTLTSFRDRFFYAGNRMPNGIVTEWILRPGAADQIQTLIEDLCFSMGAEGRLDLPPTSYNSIEVPLPASSKKAYKDMKNDLVAELDILGEQSLHSAANAAVLTSKLSQISAGFLYHDEQELNPGKYTVLHRDKARAVREVVEGTGSPVLVFYRFKAEKDLLIEELNGLARTVDEPHILDEWGEGRVPVLLAHPASAGHGLNLQHGGHTVVWSSLPWSLEEYQQANKRLARQGQRHPVIIHHVVSPQTVDGIIMKRLAEKDGVQSALLEHLESPL